jgi:DNA-binding NarL/FixJ family response regulator
MQTTEAASAETPQRQAVRRLLARGLSVREVALKLGVSTQRVYQQIAAIRRADGGGEA